MQRSSFAAVLSIIFLTSVPACGPKDGDAAAEGAAKAEAGAAEAKADEAKADAGAEAKAEAGAAEAGEAAAAEAGEAAAAEAGEVAAAEAGEAAAEAGEAAAEAGEAEAGEAAAEAGEAEAGEIAAGEEDPVPALLETAKSLDNDDAAAKQALSDALGAGAAKLDAAKAANARGVALMTKGESERAEAFFTWSKDTHSKYADPVYNLAKLAAYAGELDLAKEHLAELQRRGNKKLMRSVGVEGAFAPLHDDPDVRKIYEQ